MNKKMYDFIDLSQSDLIYLGVVSGIALLLAVSLPWFISRQESSRVDRLEKLKRFSPIRTRSPEKQQQEAARSTAVESVGGRFSIIRKITLVLVFLIWAIAVTFPFLGLVPRTVISILVSITGVVVGIAARPFIENSIAGVIISFSKLFRIGDTVDVDSQYGTVEDISITHSVVKLWDWRRYVIPNSKMLQKEVINYSLDSPYLWAHVEFWVSWEADLSVVEYVALSVARQNMLDKTYEQPRFWVMAMEKEAVKCWVAAWNNSAADAWIFRARTRYDLVHRLQAEGVTPHLHLYEGKSFDRSVLNEKISREGEERGE
ncbi:MAG: mechanosensitive ion channel family protein [Spirochaetaceae bacterium]